MSFDGHFEALFIKLFVITFGNILTEIGTFQVGAFKFINIREMCNFDKFYQVSMVFQFRNTIFHD